jgi:hypothetical protein
MAVRSKSTNSLLLLLGERTITPWIIRKATTSSVSTGKRTNSLPLLLGECTITPWITRSATTNSVSTDKRTKYQVRGPTALSLSTLGIRMRQKLCSKEDTVESIRRAAGTATRTLATELTPGFMGGHIMRCHDERIRKQLE